MDPTICVTTVSPFGPYMSSDFTTVFYSVSSPVSTHKDSSVMHSVPSMLKSGPDLFKMAAVSSKIAFVPVNH